MRRLALAAVLFVASSAAASNGLVQLGALTTPCGGPAYLDSPRTLTISLDGTSVYAVGSAAGDIADAVIAFERDGGTGDLSTVQELADALGNQTRDSIVSPDGAHVYVVGGNWLYGFARDGTSGAVTFVQALTDNQGGVDGLLGAWRIAISPDGGHVYVAAEGEDEIGVFTRDAGTGLLSFVEVQQDGVGGVTGLAEPHDVAVSPDGDHVYVTGDDDVLVFTRDGGTGALTFVEAEDHTPVQGLQGPDRVALSPDGLFVYTSSASGVAAEVGVFSRDLLTGELDFVQAFSQGLIPGIRSLNISPDGGHLYAGGGDFDSILVLERDGTLGTVSHAQTVTAFPDSVFGDLRVSPDGAHVYGLSESSVHVFDRDGGTGLLTWSTSVLDPQNPVVVRTSPDGATVYSACERAIGVAARDAGTGVLTFVEQVRFDGSGNAFANMTVSPDGTTVYVIQNFTDTLYVFDRDSGTGALTFVEQHVQGVAGVDGLAGPTAAAVTSDGEFLYVSSFFSTVAVFDRDPLDGTLTFVDAYQMAPGPIPDPFDPRDLAVTLDGAHVYTIARALPVSDGQVVHLDRDAGTGLLTFVDRILDGGGSAASGLDTPTALAVSPDDAHVYVLSSGDDAVTALARDQATGTLTFVSSVSAFTNGSSSPTTAASVHVDPSGFYVYAVSGTSLSGDPQLTVLRRDPGSGMPTIIETRGSVTSGDTVLAGLTDAVASPDGKHVYAIAKQTTVVYGRAQACSPTPALGCVAADTSTTKLKTDAVTTSNRLVSKWTGPGPIASGDPLTTTDLAVCVYDGSGAPGPIIDAAVPSGGTCGTKPCWKGIVPGFKYRDAATTPDGIIGVKIIVGTTGPAKVTVKGKRGALPPFALPLVDPVTAQLQFSNGTCLEATYAAAVLNDGVKYTGKMP